MCFCLIATLANKCCCCCCCAPLLAGWASLPSPLCALHSPPKKKREKEEKRKEKGATWLLRQICSCKVNQNTVETLFLSPEWKLIKQKKSADCVSCALSFLVAHWLLFLVIWYLLLWTDRGKLIVSLHGKWRAFMNWGACLFMLPIDGHVKECSLSVTWGYFDIVLLDNE